MSASNAFAKARDVLVSGRDLDAKLLLAAGITALASAKGLKPVVTGGTCVDFYAANAVDSAPRVVPAWKPSVDVDVVLLTSDSMEAAATLRILLHKAGFRPAGGREDQESVRAERGWQHPELPLPIEIIGKPFAGDVGRIIEMDVDGLPVFLRGPEDTLWEHIEWGVHARDQRSWTRALAIAKAQRAQLDLEYLRELAKERGFSEALERCLRGEALSVSRQAG